MHHRNCAALLRPSNWLGLIHARLLRVPALLPTLERLSPSQERLHRDPDPGPALVIVAHPDDDLLFMSPDLVHDLRAGRRVTTVFLTAGDAGGPTNYVLARERGIQAAYAVMAGLPDDWQTSQILIEGHRILTRTLVAAPHVSVDFLRLPDGGPGHGDGYPSHGYQSLPRLLDARMPSITTVDDSATYTLDSLVASLARIMSDIQPAVLRTQDLLADSDDHPDHIATAKLACAAHHACPGTRTLLSYADYRAAQLPANVGLADAVATQLAINAYGHYDEGIHSFTYAVQRQYVNAATQDPTDGQEDIR